MSSEIQNLQAEIAELKKACNRKDDALRACRIFVTPVAKRKMGDRWDEYHQDASNRLHDEIGTGV